MREDSAAALGGFSPGSRIAGYLLKEQIGQGGMAVVFRALDERLNRHVALKILAPAIAADEAFRHRFIRESQAAAAVDDPHIIPVYEAGEADRVLFIAMRLVRGGDVAALVRRDGQLSPRQVAAIISPIASSLDAAHEAGLVHRDVKPANILLDVRQGRPDHVYLSDFGLSKSALGLGRITATGQFLGTPNYIAPEQISGKTVDGRADQYSLAATAFELLCGTPPFRQDEQMAVIYAHITEPPPPLTSRRPDLPVAVDAVFTRALAKVPADRFATCLEFADALRRALEITSYDASAELSPATSSPHPPTAAVVISSDPAGVRLAESGSAGGPPTQAVWPTPHSTPPHTSVLPPPALVAPHPPAYQPSVYQPPRRTGGRAAAIAAALLVLLAGAGTAVYLIESSSGQTLAKPVNWAGRHSVRSLLVLSGGARRNVVEGVAFSPDGRTLAIATIGTTYLVDVATGDRIGHLTDPDASEVKAVAFNVDGHEIATADQNGHVYLWDLAGGTAPSAPAASLPDPSGDGVFAVAFSPDGNTLAAGDIGGVTYLWQVTSGTAAPRPFAHLPDPSAGGVQGIAFSPDGTALATADTNGSTYLWQVGSGTAPQSPTATLTDPSSRGVQAVAFSPDGQTVATGDVNGGTYLWPAGTVGQSGNPQEAFIINHDDAGQFGTVAVAFSPDGRTLASGGYIGQTYLWNIATASQIGTLADPGTAFSTASVQADQFNPDGKALATGDTNGATYLWTPR